MLRGTSERIITRHFTKILIPLSVPGIVSGITMVFVRLTTFVISNLLGGSKILLIGNVIEQEFTKGKQLEPRLPDFPWCS